MKILLNKKLKTSKTVRPYASKRNQKKREKIFKKVDIKIFHIVIVTYTPQLLDN